MDADDVYAYGWSAKGKRCPATKPGGRKERISVISGLLNSSLMAPCWFKGFTDAEVFNT